MKLVGCRCDLHSIKSLRIIKCLRNVMALFSCSLCDEKNEEDGKGAGARTRQEEKRMKMKEKKQWRALDPSIFHVNIYRLQPLFGLVFVGISDA